MAPLTLTVVRHGESKDNLRPVWAGYKDAPLSSHGINQAKRVGAFFADTPIEAVYASPLLRARWTGEQIQQQNKSHPPITFSPLLKEQFFGAMEGVTFDQSPMREDRRDFTFPEGETLDDVAKRADEAIDTFIMPHVLDAAKQTSDEPVHVFVAAHGIFNAEFIGALLRRRVEGEGSGWSRAGMTNTGWHRLELSLADPEYPQPTSHTTPQPAYTNQSSIPAANAPTKPSARPSQPKLDIQIKAVNQTSHLDGLIRVEEGEGEQMTEEQKKTKEALAGGGGKL